MSTPAGDGPGTVRKHRPYVPETMEMKELTFRAIFLGLILTVVLGAANAYLGLRAGIPSQPLIPQRASPWRCCAPWQARRSAETLRGMAAPSGQASPPGSS